MANAFAVAQAPRPALKGYRDQRSAPVLSDFSVSMMDALESVLVHKSTSRKLSLLRKLLGTRFQDQKSDIEFARDGRYFHQNDGMAVFYEDTLECFDFFEQQVLQLIDCYKRKLEEERREAEVVEDDSIASRVTAWRTPSRRRRVIHVVEDEDMPAVAEVPPLYHQRVWVEGEGWIVNTALPPYVPQRRIVEDQGLPVEEPADILWDPHPFGWSMDLRSRPSRGEDTILGWISPSPQQPPRLTNARRDPGCIPPPQCQTKDLEFLCHFIESLVFVNPVFVSSFLSLTTVPEQCPSTLQTQVDPQGILCSVLAGGV